MNIVFKISLIVYLVFSSLVVNCQTFFGLQGGMVRSKMNFTPLRNSISIDNPYYGLIFKRIEPEQTFWGRVTPAFQMEVNYTRRGWSEANTTLDTILLKSCTYIDVPLITQFIIGTKKTAFFVNIGSQLGYSFDGAAKITVNGIDTESNYSFPDSTDNRMDFALLVGGGLVMDTKIGTFQIEGRANIGFTNVIKMPVMDTPTLAQQRSFIVSIAYMFHKQKKKTPEN